MSIPKAPIKIKLTGDTHLPDVESDLDIEEGASSLARLAQPRDQGGRPAVRHAGVLMAPSDDMDVDTTTGARDAGTSRPTQRRDGAGGRDASREGAGRGSRPQGMQQPQRAGAMGARPQLAARSATGLWIGALVAAALLVRLMR